MTHDLTQEVLDVVLAYMEALHRPRALTVAILARYGEWDQLTSLETDPARYLTSSDYLRDVAATDLLRKYRDFDLSVDLEASAIEKWWWAERECYRTNERLSPFLFGAYGPKDEAIASFLGNVRKNVEYLLGDRPPTLLQGRFGPGATMSDMSRYVTVPDKMSSTPTFTPRLPEWFSSLWTETKWAMASAELGNFPSMVRGNAFFTVPKTARSLRACAKEPSINGFYQLALGRAMKSRLRRKGIDLSEGQDVHRQVACSASLSGDLATIDLSSASDTVCINLVKLVLPYRWLRLLDATRSPYTLVQGKQVLLEKYSSMGNGFTFELETTIFAAICMAVMGSSALPGVNLFVYGDDIIVPTEFSKDVIAALKFMGFTPNPRKTFTEGPFRESCGGDYFAGKSVRAFYLQESPNEPQEIIAFANGIRRLGLQNGLDLPTRLRLRRAWFKCLDLLPSHIRRCRGPQALGDTVIHDDEERWDIRWRANGIRYVRVYRPARYRLARWEGFAYCVQFASALYLDQSHAQAFRWLGPSTQDASRRIVLRDGVCGYKIGWTPYS